MSNWFQRITSRYQGRHYEHNIIPVGKAYLISYPTLYFDKYVKAAQIDIKEWCARQYRKVELLERRAHRKALSNYGWLSLWTIV